MRQTLNFELGSFVFPGKHGLSVDLGLCGLAAQGEVVAEPSAVSGLGTAQP
jgi:hypothetical protein